MVLFVACKISKYRAEPAFDSVSFSSYKNDPQEHAVLAILNTENMCDPVSNPNPQMVGRLAEEGSRGG